MVVGTLFLLLAIPITLIFSIGIPIVIAVVVYRDADKRIDCNPWLWAIVAALIPSYVGVIVYLIVRNDYPLRSTANFDNSNYQGDFENVGAQPKVGFPTWAKALIIVGAVIVGICIIGFVGAIAYSIFSKTGIFSFYDYL